MCLADILCKTFEKGYFMHGIDINMCVANCARFWCQHVFDQSKPTPTSAPSHACLLWLNYCGWISTELISGFTLVRASAAVFGMWSCTVKLDEENPIYAGFGQGAQHNCTGCHGRWKTQHRCAHAEKSVINMINWCSIFLIIMIGPGGLLLVVPHLFAFPVLVLLVGLQKST